MYQIYLLLLPLPSVCPQDSVQQTMLVSWLVELWLNQLGRVRDQIESDGKLDLTHEHEVLQEEFRLFLAKGDIRVNTVM